MPCVSILHYLHFHLRCLQKKLMRIPSSAFGSLRSRQLLGLYCLPGESWKVVSQPVRMAITIVIPWKDCNEDIKYLDGNKCQCNGRQRDVSQKSGATCTEVEDQDQVPSQLEIWVCKWKRRWHFELTLAEQMIQRGMSLMTCCLGADISKADRKRPRENTTHHPWEKINLNMAGGDFG